MDRGRVPGLRRLVGARGTLTLTLPVPVPVPVSLPLPLPLPLPLQRLGGVAALRERTPGSRGGRRPGRRPSFAVPLGVSAIDANALGGRGSELGPLGRPHQVAVGDAHAGAAGAEAEGGNSPRAHGGVHDGVTPPRLGRCSSVNEGSERDASRGCQRPPMTSSSASGPVDKLFR